MKKSRHEPKKNSKLHIPLPSELKEQLEAKALSLGISLNDFIRMVLSNSLRGEIIIKP